jgi:hypothetical protein
MHRQIVPLMLAEAIINHDLGDHWQASRRYASYGLFTPRAVKAMDEIGSRIPRIEIEK